MSADEELSRGYHGPLSLISVPYSKGIFNFHWFNFFNAICFQIIIGAPTVLLAKDLGANSFVLGIIAAFTPLMTTLQLPAAKYLGRFSYRSFALMGWGLRSVFIACAAMIPLLGFLSKEYRLGLLLLSLFFFNLIRGVSTAAFLPWVTSVVDGTIRGRFLAVDNIFINAASFLTMMLCAFLMRGHAESWQYALVLWISVIGAVISLFYLRMIPDRMAVDAGNDSSTTVRFSTMFRFAPFSRWICFNLVAAFVMGGLAVFPVEYLKVQAHFSPSLIFGLSAFTFLGPVIVLKPLGTLVDHHGSIPYLRLALLSFSVVLTLWFAMSAGVLPSCWWLVLLLNITGGASTACLTIANGHLWMAVVPEKGKNHFFALSTVIISFAAGVVPLLWGATLDALGSLDRVVGPFHLRRHSIYFLGITLLCITSFFLARILIEPGRVKK